MHASGHRRNQPPWLERLPSGRHRLTRDVVVASQRGRLLDAIAEAVAEKGYAATTVADVVSRAGVSRRTFYEQFPDKEACFVHAYDAAIDYVLARMAEALSQAGETDWRERARLVVSTFIDVLAEEPAFARTLCVESLAAGPVVLARRAAALQRFAENWRALHELARQQQPTLPAQPIELFRVLVGGQDELLREHLRTGDVDALHQLTGALTQTALAVLGARP